MPCKIQIKENITRTIEDRTESGFNKPLAVAQSIARGVNADFGTTVVRFVQRDVDFIDRIIEVPSSLVDQYYYNELALEEQEARNIQQQDAERMGESYDDDYLFQTKNIFVATNEIENKLRSVNKTINSIGSEKNVNEILKKAGLDSELRKQFIQLVNDNPSLKSLKISEVLGTYLREFVKDSDRQYYKAIDAPLSNELENILIDYFDKFKIRRQELDNIKEKFGVDSVGVFDVLAKTVYYAKNRNLLTLPEEYGHVFVELLGSIGNKKADNPLFKYMFDNIDKWDGYQRVLRDYKDLYVTKEGNMDIYKIKKEAIGQAIGIALVRNFKSAEGLDSFWSKVQELIDYVLDLIKGVDYVSLNTTVDSVAKDILNKNYDKLDRMRKDTSNYNLLTYSETIKNQNKIDGGKALNFMQWFSQKGMLITGSLAYRLQGTTYRPEIDALHDIDNIVPSDVHKVSLNKQDYLTPEQLESSRLYYKYISEGNYREAKKHKLQGNIRLNIDEIVDNVEVLQEFKEQFPDTDFLYSFYNEKANAFYITINAIWSENQELKDKFKSYTGSFNSRLENFTKEELEQIYLFDFFLRPESSEEYKKIEDPEFGLSLAHFNYAFYEKLNMMGRAKDAFDYQMWDYYNDDSILAPDFNDRLVYFQIQQSKEVNKNVSLQKESVPASRASKETIEKIKKIAESAGISFQDLQDYLKGNPEVNVKDINGLADIMKGIIAIAEGKEDVALTEEFVHVASAIVNQTNPKLITEMISKIDRFKIYQKVLKEYSKDPNYQLPNGKPDIRKIKREAVDKLIAEIVIKQSEGSTEFPELMEEINRSMIRKFWEAILDVFRMQYRKANINIFETTSELISSGNLGARYMNNVKPGVQELFKSNPELANKVYEVLGFNDNNFELKENKEAFGKEPHPEGATSYDIFSNGRKIGKIALFDGKNPMIKGLNLNESERNKGLGKALYKWLNYKATLKGGRLYADQEFISPAAQRVWESLNKEGLVDLTGNSPKFNDKQKQQAQEQYSQYLDTIFPDSKVKDIVYHGTDRTFEQFSKDAEKVTIADQGMFFAPTKNQARNSGKNVIKTVLDLNPLISDDRIERISNKKKEEILDKGYNGYVYSYNKTISSADDIVVFEPEQIHILGNKQDVEGFKSFMETAPAEFKPTESGVFLQKAQQEYTPAQLELQQRLLTSKDNIQKVENKTEKVDPILLDTEEASNFYEIKQPDGTYVKLTKRVTDRVKAWYKKRFGDKQFSEAQKEFNELKRELGIKFHYFVEDIHGRYFNPDGTRKQSPGRRTIKIDPADDAVYQKLEDYFTDLVKEFSKDGKNPMVFSEVIVYDPKEQEAGTIDLLIVDGDGKANIFDWKFMSISEQSNDVPWFKQGAFGIQLSRYRDILKDAYGVKEFGLNRAIPILMDFKRINPFDNESKLVLKGVNVGSVNVSEIEDLRLVPVSEETESTGDKRLDKLIKELNTIYRQISKSDVTSDEEREFKRERLNLLRKAIRSAQSSKDISPMIDVINIMRIEGEQIINDWETIYSKRAASDRDFENVELSDYADNIREYIAISEVFGRIDDLIGDLIYNKEMEATAETKEEKAEVAYRKEVLDQIRDEKSKIANSRDEVKEIAKKFADKFMGERNLVKGLLNPEAIWKGVSSFFRGASDSPLASIQILFKIVTNARGKASMSANKLVDDLLEIRKSLVARGGDTKALIQKIYQKDDKNNLVNKIVYKYKKEFYTGVDDNAIEGNQDKNWLMKNINIDEYKKEALDMLNKRVKSLSNLYSENEELRNQLILEEYRKWDISRSDFNGWNNYIIKRHPKDIWFSEEYKEIEKDPDLLKLYNFISEINDEAGDVGYIQNKIHSTFLPFVRKSMAESLAWDFSLSSIMNMGDSLSLRADDVGYGSINELTNEMEHAIPKYYTTDFTKKEDGTNDYSDVSEDLFKNMILYINHMQKYKYLSEVEGQLNLVKTIESFKNHYATKRNSDIVIENGVPKELSGNEENTKMFDDFLRALFYEQKYPISDADTGLNISVKNFMKKAINKVARKEVLPIDENPDALSLVKMMDAANRAFQLKTLGFDFISGAVNLFGANIQMATQAGNYMKGREFIKNEMALIGNKFKNDDERKMFIQLIETFMPLKDDPTYDKLQEAGLSKLTNVNFGDWLMVFMRNPEQHVEKSIFKTLLDNTMVIDGKLVNIREFVKNKYKDRYSSSEAYRQAKDNIDKEIEELKRTKSITNTKELVDGKLVIPGFDLNNINEIQRLTNLTRRIARNATGGLTDADLNRMQMSIWTKSMMVFKNWIPKLVDTRFGEFRKISDDFSVEIDEDGMTTGEKYDVGRIRLFLPFLSLNIIKTIKDINDILSVTEDGISKLDALYKKYAEDYKNKTGQDLNMSKEDFNDLIINNLRNQIKELTTLLALLGLAFSLGLISPDDDEDKATKNAHRYAQRVVDKFVGELSFFYNPVEIQKILSGSSFPAIGLFTDIIRFTKHATMEFTGIDLADFEKSPEEARKKAQPIKNAMKMLPVTKSLVTYLAIFDEEFAKEYDVTIQKEVNR